MEAVARKGHPAGTERRIDGHIEALELTVLNDQSLDAVSAQGHVHRLAVELEIGRRR